MPYWAIDFSARLRSDPEPAPLQQFCEALWAEGHAVELQGPELVISFVLEGKTRQQAAEEAHRRFAGLAGGLSFDASVPSRSFRMAAPLNGPPGRAPEVPATPHLAGAPAWLQVQDLIESRPKPALAGDVLSMTPDEVPRRYRILFDGRDTAFMGGADRSELAGRGGTVVAERGGVRWMSRPLGKSPARLLLFGELIAGLRSSVGRVVARETVLGQDCWVCEASGLRVGETTVFRLWVDGQSGVLLRLTRPDEPGFWLGFEAIQVADVGSAP